MCSKKTFNVFDGYEFRRSPLPFWLYSSISFITLSAIPISSFYMFWSMFLYDMPLTVEYVEKIVSPIIFLCALCIVFCKRFVTKEVKVEFTFGDNTLLINYPECYNASTWKLNTSISYTFSYRNITSITEEDGLLTFYYSNVLRETCGSIENLQRGYIQVNVGMFTGVDEYAALLECMQTEFKDILFIL